MSARNEGRVPSYHVELQLQDMDFCMILLLGRRFARPVSSISIQGHGGSLNNVPYSPRASHWPVGLVRGI